VLRRERIRPVVSAVYLTSCSSGSGAPLAGVRSRYPGLTISAFHLAGTLAARSGVVLMSVLQPDRGDPAAQDGEAPVTEPTEAPGAPVVPRRPAVPRTRWGAAWVGICAAALALVLLIVFMLQNTRRVEVTFL
jgi:hypothetical protein